MATSYNMPPGCTVGEMERATMGPDPTNEEDEILGLLEDAGVPTEICDKVMAVVAKIVADTSRLRNDMPTDNGARSLTQSEIDAFEEAAIDARIAGATGD